MTSIAYGALQAQNDPDDRIADLDEDEATLAVDAGRAALRSANVDPTTVKRLVVRGFTRDLAWAQHVAIALGLAHARLDSEGEQGPDALTIIVEASRSAPTRAGKARASLGTASKPSAVASPPSAVVDADGVQRLLAAEQRCLLQVPMGAHVSRATWEQSLEARYRLLVSTCSHCEASHHPALDPCPRCGRPTTRSAHGEGALYTWTTITKGGGPTEFDEWQSLRGDYAVAVVELAPGVRVAGMMTLVQPSALRIGSRVRPVFRRLYAQEGAWRYGVKFEPLR